MVRNYAYAIVLPKAGKTKSRRHVNQRKADEDTHQHLAAIRIVQTMFVTRSGTVMSRECVAGSSTP